MEVEVKVKGEVDYRESCVPVQGGKSNYLRKEGEIRKEPSVETIRSTKESPGLFLSLKL